MNKSRLLRRGRTCVFLMHVHLVFVTKYRRKVFTKKIFKDLQKIFSDVCTDFEASLVEFEWRKGSRASASELPPKGVRFQIGQQPQRCFLPPIAQKRVPFCPKIFMGECFVVP